MSSEPLLPQDKPKRTISSFDSLFAYKPKYSLETLNAYSVQLLNLKHSALKGAAGSFVELFQKSPDIFSKFEDRATNKATAPVEDLTSDTQQTQKQTAKPKIRIEYKPLLKSDSDPKRFTLIPNQPTASLFGHTKTCSSYPTVK